MSAILDYSSVVRRSFLSPGRLEGANIFGMETVSSGSAKRFLLAKVEEQALHDGVPLSELEKKMFLFSEETASDSMRAVSEEFDSTCDDAEYEAKVSKLLEAAFHGDKNTPDAVAEWKKSLKALGDEDFYGLVMVQQAGLPFSRRSVVGDVRIGMGAFVDLAPIAAVALAVGIPGFLIVFDPFQWGLIHSQWMRLSLFPVFAFGVWCAVSKYSAWEFRQSRKRP